MKTTVTLVREVPSDYPELWMDVFIVGDKSEKHAFAEMFAKGRCRYVDLPEDADLVVFTGGDDVNPALYGEKPHAATHFNDARDTADIAVYLLCLEKGIPMFGVCRGAQFLHVMQGGALYQDIDNHNGHHTMWDKRKKKLLKTVSSVHHQACKPNEAGGMEILGTSYTSKNRALSAETTESGYRDPDVEAYFYRDTCVFGVQGHPEYRGYSEFRRWCVDMINELIIENPDVELRDGVRRLKPDLLAGRPEKGIQLAA